MSSNKNLNNLVLNYDNMKILLFQLNNSNNDIRKNAEEVLMTLKYNIDAYAVFLSISQNETEKNIKIQSLLILKNLSKQLLSLSGDKFRARIVGLENSNTYKGKNYNFTTYITYITFTT